METSYLTLPFGKISKAELRPWLEWIEKQNYAEFVSYPAIVDYFKGTVPEEKDKFILNYKEEDLVDQNEFLSEEVLFYISIIFYELVESNVRITVKFLCNGTVEIGNIYYDDGEETPLLKQNFDNIDSIIEQKQNEKKLSWKEFTEFYEEIISGVYNKELALPNFYGL